PAPAGRPRCGRRSFADCPTLNASGTTAPHRSPAVAVATREKKPAFAGPSQCAVLGSNQRPPACRAWTLPARYRCSLQSTLGAERYEFVTRVHSSRSRARETTLPIAVHAALIAANAPAAAK